MIYTLLPKVAEGAKYYKANLHCHSTFSDGKKTVEEIKRDYMAHGYSAVAFSDHDLFLTHNDLTDDNFVALNAYEIELGENRPGPFDYVKNCHLCLIAKTPDITQPVCLHREKYSFPNANAYQKDMDWGDAPNFEREYTAECANRIAELGHENGFHVTYNHPTWSLEHWQEYSKYHGMDAMEIYNGLMHCIGYDDENSRVYDEFLMLGKRMHCIASDDNHCIAPDDSPYCDCYRGYVMIPADQLDYTTLMDQITRGQFYSATGNYKNEGPKILGLEYNSETRKLTIWAEGARDIFFHTDVRIGGAAHAEDGSTIDQFTFDVPETVSWFRLQLVSDKGFKAYTNAYYMDEYQD